jgi:hypothetical protein
MFIMGTDCVVCEFGTDFLEYFDPFLSSECLRFHLSGQFILLAYLLTYLLTPWSRVLLEKLTGFVASQKIPRIYGTRKFITVLTSARHYLYYKI